MDLSSLDVVEEILINVGSDSDDEPSDEEVEPDGNVPQCLTYESVLSHSHPVEDKPCCSWQLQMEHTGSLSTALLKFVTSLTLID